MCSEFILYFLWGGIFNSCQNCNAGLAKPNGLEKPTLQLWLNDCTEVRKWMSNYIVLMAAITYPDCEAAAALVDICGPFYQHGLTLIPAWISNYIHYNVWNELLIHS